MSRLPQLSLFYFASDAEGREAQKYRLLLESGKLADELGFAALWVPERHFQQFGGLYGSPSVTATALAVTTKRIQIRAGSVVLPLQSALRVAEEWSMIDHLSGGRVAIAIASGWHADDFVLNPSAYARRQEDVEEKLALIARLWNGEKIPLPNGVGDIVKIGILPRPLQPKLTIWLTTLHEDGFKLAGRLGYNVLTSNFANAFRADILQARIEVYRKEITEHHSRPGTVTLMSHTFVSATDEEVNRLARPAMERYVEASIPLFATQKPDAPRRMLQELEPRLLAHVVASKAEQNISNPLSLIGSASTCRAKAEAMAAIGVDEIACLVDFGVPFEDTMAGVRRLAEL